jgi:transposase
MRENLQSIPAFAPQPNDSTIGLDLGDRWSRYCVLDRNGEIVKEDRVRTTTAALEQRFRQVPATRIVMEAGTHSPLGEPPVAELRP